jgi:subtilisin-like proprotein convertase family protein
MGNCGDFLLFAWRGFAAKSQNMKLKFSVIISSAAAILLVAETVSAVSFTGSVTNAGIIPDSPYGGPAQYGTPLVVSFNVSNLQTSVQSVSLTVSMYHQYLGDLDVELASPTGTNFIVFSRVGLQGSAIDGGFGNPDALGMAGGSDGHGSYTNIASATYTFIGSATNTLRSWDASSLGFGLNNGGNNSYGEPIYIIPGGSYLPSSEGPDNDSATTFATNSGFIGLPPAKANGAWTLTFKDGSNGGTGVVQSATLYLGQTLHFTGITVTNGAVRMTLTGQVSTNFTIWASTNLTVPFASWSSFGGGTLDSSGNGIFQTNDAIPVRFYRASSP